MNIKKLKAAISKIEVLDKEIIGLEKIADKVACEKTESHSIRFSFKEKEEEKRPVLDSDGSLIGKQMAAAEYLWRAYMQSSTYNAYNPVGEPIIKKNDDRNDIDISDVQMLQIIGLILKEKYELRRSLLIDIEKATNKP